MTSQHSLNLSIQKKTNLLGQPQGATEYMCTLSFKNWFAVTISVLYPHLTVAAPCSVHQRLQRMCREVVPLWIQCSIQHLLVKYFYSICCPKSHFIGLCIFFLNKLEFWANKYSCNLSIPGAIQPPSIKSCRASIMQTHSGAMPDSERNTRMSP